MEKRSMIVASRKSSIAKGRVTENLHKFIDKYLDDIRYPAEKDDANDPRYRARIMVSEEIPNIMKEYPQSLIKVELYGNAYRLAIRFEYSNVDDFNNRARAIRVKKRIQRSTGKEVLEEIQKKHESSGGTNAGLGNYLLMNYCDKFIKRPIFKNNREGTCVLIVINKNRNKNKDNYAVNI